MSQYRNFSSDNGMRNIGMPLVTIFRNLICMKDPEKCPVFYDVYRSSECSREEGYSGQN